MGDENQCDKRGARSYYRYYDSPDGCHVEKKILVTTRYGIIMGLIAGTYDVMMYSHAVGLGNMLKRYSYHVVPLGLMGTTFAAVANGVQHYRDIDDPFNYFFGGLACGPLLAWYLRSGHGVVAGGIVLGIIGAVKKMHIDSNTRMVLTNPNHMNTIASWRNDWTIATDPRDSLLHTCKEHTEQKKK